MTAPFIPPPATRRLTPPTVRSLARWRWQGCRFTLDAITGQVGTLVRAATGTALDSLGGTITWPHSAARYEVRTVNGVPRGGVRLVTDDLTWPCTFGPETGTLVVEWSQLAALANNAGVCYIGDDAQAGNRLIVRGGAANALVVELKIGANTSSATLVSAIAVNDAAWLVIQLEDDGTNQRVRVAAALNGVDLAFSAWGAWIARGTAYAAGAKVRLNRLGSAGVQNNMFATDGAWFPGVLLTVAQSRERL